MDNTQNKKVRFVSAGDYLFRCKNRCRDIFPCYSNCNCSNCFAQRRKPAPSINLGECPIGEVQSDVTPALNVSEQPEGCTDHENVCFTDEIDQTLLSLGSSQDHTFSESFQENADLGNFLSRPIQIYRRQWDVGAAPWMDFINPWQLFTQTISVRNKLERFKLLRGTLVLKLVVNGTPFMYGRAVAGVRPTRFNNAVPTSLTPIQAMTLINAATPGGAGVSTRPGRTLYTQRPHIYLDPSTNMGGVIRWPFVKDANYIDQRNSSPAIESMVRMGVLELWELTQLRTAKAGPSTARIAIFAWLEDVELTGPTYGVAAIQSDKVVSGRMGGKSGVSTKQIANSTHIAATKKSSGNDEYGKGVVSQPATTVAKAASYFTNIPVIGPFAKATEIGANAVGSVAQLFGYSRPAQLEDHSQIRPLPTGRMAVTSGGDPLAKLSLDPKQELTIDNRTIGLDGTDELSFLSIAKREAWVGEFNWQTTGASSNNTLCMIAVTPLFEQVDDTLGVRRMWQTPVSFIAKPFSYWTGSLRYRFQIVASQFHRGRLLFQYEPHLIGTNFATQQSVLTADGEGLNARYSFIVDIAEERDVTFEVNWAQSDAWRPLFYDTLPAYTSNQNLIYQQRNSIWPNTGEYLYQLNGVIRVSVMTTLQAPDDAPIVINFFQSAGDSFQVACPNTTLQTLAYSRVNTIPEGLIEPEEELQPEEQKVGEVQSNFFTEEENMPQQSTKHIINGAYRQIDADATNIFFGEVVTSIRTMLKRYCYHRSLYRDLSGQMTGGNRPIVVTNAQQKDFPNGPGVYGSSEGSTFSRVVISAANVNYNICAMTYIRYYAQAFVGYRGAVRWKINATRTGPKQNSYMGVTRRMWIEEFNALGVEGWHTANLIVANETNKSSRYQIRALNHQLASDHSVGGTHMTNVSVNPTLEYEVPFYAPLRYAELHEGWTQPNGDLYHSVLMRRVHNITTIVCPPPAVSYEASDDWGWDVILDTYCAAGEDFTFFFFIGAPPYVYSDVTAQTPAPDVAF